MVAFARVRGPSINVAAPLPLLFVLLAVLGQEPQPCTQAPIPVTQEAFVRRQAQVRMIEMKILL